MGSGLSIKFDTQALRSRFKNYQNDLKTLLQSEWPEIVQTCLADVLRRAPDPATEYAYLMGIEGGVGYGEEHSGKASGLGEHPDAVSTTWRPDAISAHRIVDHPKGGGWASRGRPARSVSSPSRIRFIRTPGMWMKELIEDPSTWKSSFKGSKFTINLGYVKALEKLSHFSWVNYSGSTGESYMHTSLYGTWSFFEYGLSNLVQPHRWSSSGASGHLLGNGLGYKLKPTDYEHYWAMMKHYPKLRMYTGFDKAVFIDAVSTRIKAVKF